MGFRSGLVSKAKRMFAPSPTKDKSLNGKDPVGGFDLRVNSVEHDPDFAGNAEEIFFDSWAWLDSDCEDDFFSVNGDFTPSRGSTPDYQRRAPAVNTVIFTDRLSDTKSEPSPTSRRKLADLFQEKLQDEKTVSEQTAVEDKLDINMKPIKYNLNGNQTLKLVDVTPSKSEGSSVEATPGSYPKKNKGKTGNAARCCFPSLVRTFIADERRQKMSPDPCAA
ncbi:uncharacterized protein At3g27210-like isoform X1 [Typha latifolia]|uniref:uncharacterized protein At3g27210-like isoform X1 n=1 Tax=Typha latifolia TaxID=4733 RepID=UPI003C2DECE2